MDEKEPQYIRDIECKKCLNKTTMRIVAQYSQVQDHVDDRNGLSWSSGPVYNLLLCPACEAVSLSSTFYFDQADPDDWHFQILYPSSEEVSLMLPDKIAKAYDAARKVRNIDPNAFGVLLRRLLELVCKGKVLHTQLRDLASRQEIPKQLAEMAHALRQFGNIGAHASAGELTEEEVPFLDKLCQAILEYVYHAPRVLEDVRVRLDRLKEQRARANDTSN
jgi:hypothetical protein